MNTSLSEDCGAFSTDDDELRDNRLTVSPDSAKHSDAGRNESNDTDDDDKISDTESVAWTLHAAAVLSTWQGLTCQSVCVIHSGGVCVEPSSTAFLDLMEISSCLHCVPTSKNVFRGGGRVMDNAAASASHSSSFVKCSMPASMQYFSTSCSSVWTCFLN